MLTMRTTASDVDTSILTRPSDVDGTDHIMSISTIAKEFELSARGSLAQEFGKVRGLEALADAARRFGPINPEKSRQMLIEVAEKSEEEGIYQAQLAKKQDAGELFFKALQACVEAQSIDVGGDGKESGIKKALGKKAVQIFQNMKLLDIPAESNAGDFYIMLSEAAKLIGKEEKSVEFKENALERFIYYAETNKAHIEAARNSLYRAQDVAEELIKTTEKSCSDPKEKDGRLSVLKNRIMELTEMLHKPDFNKIEISITGNSSIGMSKRR